MIPIRSNLPPRQSTSQRPRTGALQLPAGVWPSPATATPVTTMANGSSSRRHRILFRGAICVLILIGCMITLTAVSAAEVIPPKPASHFNDYAGVVPPAKASELNRTLEEFERSSSSQVVVAIFPRMQTGSSIEDYTRRIAEGWHVGQKEKNNGA